MRAIGVIPARFGSTRFPGKPLKQILGKPLLQWVVEGARQARKLNEVIVATDDDRIVALARKIGCEAMMTPSELSTGSDRVWNAVSQLESRGSIFDVVVNIQGDEPLITGDLLDQLVDPFETNAELEMATLGRPISKEDLESNNTAKIVMNLRDEAIYFSRFPIPFSREPLNLTQSVSLKHIGLYAYKRLFLERFCNEPPTALEKAESLEQLRALYLGARIKVVRVNHESWGVDTPDDVVKVEAKLRLLGRA